MADSNKTKEKILTVTEELLIADGIENVSIRNIASINYYFSTKTHLLAKILERKINNLKKELSDSLIHTKKIEKIHPIEFISLIFDIFFKEKTIYFSHYKIILEPGVQNLSYLENSLNEIFFPLGQKLILENLKNFYPAKQQLELKRISFHIWGVIHHSLFLMSQPFYHEKNNSEEYSPQFIKESLLKTSNAILNGP
jgi:AcrR family transcriptional regulator